MAPPRPAPRLTLGGRVCVGLVLASCGGAPPSWEEAVSPNRSAGETSRGSALQVLYDGDGRPLTQPPAPRHEPRAVSPVPSRPRPPRATPPPARRARRDVRFHDARLDDALRMLAEAANLGLVLSGPLAQPIHLELTAVDPVDAIELLATTHDLEVTFRRGVVVVRPRG